MANTRAALLDSAERRIKDRGFDAVSYADMGLDVGVRKASIHYHFPSKGDLSLAVVQRYHARFMTRLDEISRKNLRASGQLLAFVDLYREALQGGQSVCLCVAMSVTQQALPDATRSALAEFHADVATWLGCVFRLAGSDGSVRHVTDPHSDGYAALAQIEGAQVIARSARDMARFEAAIDTLRRRAI